MEERFDDIRLYTPLHCKHSMLEDGKQEVRENSDLLTVQPYLPTPHMKLTAPKEGRLGFEVWVAVPDIELSVRSF